MKNSELKALALDELQEKLDKQIKDLYQMRLRATTKELERPTDIRAGRRDIARIKQAIGDKQREASKNASK
ncbi:MAG: 50S ribosomal protein L29 [Candidatus Sumerlaeaceae bacterium]